MTENNELKIPLYHNVEAIIRKEFPLVLVFQDEDKEVGRLWYDRNLETWFFDGNLDVSAKSLVAWLRVTFKQQIEEHYGRQGTDADSGVAGESASPSSSE